VARFISVQISSLDLVQKGINCDIQVISGSYQFLQILLQTGVFLSNKGRLDIGWLTSSTPKVRKAKLDIALPLLLALRLLNLMSGWTYRYYVHSLLRLPPLYLFGWTFIFLVLCKNRFCYVRFVDLLANL